MVNYYGIGQAAELLGCSYSRLYDAIKEQKIPQPKRSLGNHCVFTDADIARLKPLFDRCNKPWSWRGKGVK